MLRFHILRAVIVRKAFIVELHEVFLAKHCTGIMHRSPKESKRSEV